MEIVRLRGHLANVRPRVFFLDALIGNFLERVLVCVFFVLLFLLFYSYLLVAFLPELTATLAMAPIWAFAGTASTVMIAGIVKALISTTNNRKRLDANIEVVTNPALLTAHHRT